MGCCIVVGRTYQGVTGRHLQLVLPANLVNGVLEGLHNTLVGGHMGERKTLEKVCACSYWPGQRKEVEQWCRNCNVCLSRKSSSHKARAPMEISQTLAATHAEGCYGHP